MTEDDAAYYAETMDDLQRKAMLMCSTKQSYGYSRLAEMAGMNHSDVKNVGNFLQSANLATIKYIRHGREFAGSAIFLNQRGEQVRLAVAQIQPENQNAKNN